MTALRTQQIIACESGVADVVDPMAGSYFLIYVQKELENKTRQYLKNIDEMGGAVLALEKGYQIKEIEKSAYNYQKSIESGEKPVVGVNIFTEAESEKIEILKVSPESEIKQIRRLKAFKAKRDNNKLEKALKILEEMASLPESELRKNDSGLMPYIINCVRENATVGEISDALRKVWGSYKSEYFK